MKHKALSSCKSFYIATAAVLFIALNVASSFDIRPELELARANNTHETAKVHRKYLAPEKVILAKNRLGHWVRSEEDDEDTTPNEDSPPDSGSDPEPEPEPSPATEPEPEPQTEPEPEPQTEPEPDPTPEPPVQTSKPIQTTTTMRTTTESEPDETTTKEPNIMAHINELRNHVDKKLAKKSSITGVWVVVGLLGVFVLAVMFPMLIYLFITQKKSTNGLTNYISRSRTPYTVVSAHNPPPKEKAPQTNTLPKYGKFLENPFGSPKGTTIKTAVTVKPDTTSAPLSDAFGPSFDEPSTMSPTDPKLSRNKDGSSKKRLKNERSTSKRFTK